MSPPPDSDIINWIKESLGTQKCSVKIEGLTGQSDGYVSDIICVKVNFEDNKDELNLVAKVSKYCPGDDRSLSAEICNREVVFYNEIIPIFNEFQAEKNISEPFHATPKCYKAFVTEQTEVIVQENLKRRGYEVHIRQLPLNINHIKLALKNYAKFHAISLALSDQKKEVFKKLEETCYNHLIELMVMFDGMYNKGKSKIIENLIEFGRKDLAERYENLVAGGITKRVLQIFADVPQRRVLTHSDCHNGNFLFEYKNGNRDNPIAMVLIDFQLSGMRSPMLDLGLFWYCGASKKEFSKFTELMEFYHNELSLFLSQLGSDIKKLYPISTMWEDWKKYAFHGFNTATVFLELLFIDNDDAPKCEEEADKELLYSKVKDKNSYLERLAGIVEHYLDFQIK